MTTTDLTIAAASVASMPIGRYEWERIIKRIRGMPDAVARLAFVVATYADADGTRIRPGEKLLAEDVEKSVRTVRRLLAELIDRYGLLQVVRRGGGRGGKGNVTVYRLTVPTDLLERVELRPIRPDSPDTWMSSQSDDSEDIQVSGQSPPSPVDNSVSEDTQMSSQSPVDNSIERTYNAVSDQLGGHPAPIERTPCMADYHPHTNHKDQPPGSPPNATTDRAHATPVDTATPEPEHPGTPPNGRPTLDELLPLQRPPKPPPGPRCTHGLPAGSDTSGRVRCPLCRRAEPPPGAPP